MVSYFLRRLALLVPTFLGITMVIFLVTRLVPGGPVEEALQARQFQQGDTAGAATKTSGQRLSAAQIAQLKKYYGLDQPLVESYLSWLGKIVTLDFGKSTRYSDPVLPMILQRVPISLSFGLTALLLTYLLSIPLGMSKALRHHTLYDNATSWLVFVGYALPGFIVGIALLSVFSFQLGWLPLGGLQSSDYADLSWTDQIADRVSHMVLPLIAYTLGDFAVLTLVMKNNLMESMAADYVRTAVAKGRTFQAALWAHAFRNSLIPIASGLGGFITVFLAGSFLIESIFNIRGMGLLGYSALQNQDYPVVLGVLALTAFLSLLANVLGDLFVSMVDPRVRFGA